MPLHVSPTPVLYSALFQANKPYWHQTVGSPDKPLSIKTQFTLRMQVSRQSSCKLVAMSTAGISEPMQVAETFAFQLPPTEAKNGEQPQMKKARTADELEGGTAAEEDLKV